MEPLFPDSFMTEERRRAVSHLYTRVLNKANREFYEAVSESLAMSPIPSPGSGGERSPDGASRSPADVDESDGGEQRPPRGEPQDIPRYLPDVPPLSLYGLERLGIPKRRAYKYLLAVQEVLGTSFYSSSSNSYSIPADVALCVLSSSRVLSDGGEAKSIREAVRKYLSGEVVPTEEEIERVVRASTASLGRGPSSQERGVESPSPEDVKSEVYYVLERLRAISSEVEYLVQRLSSLFPQDGESGH